MKSYKGYFIDGIIFNSKKDIDKFLEFRAIVNYPILCAKFRENPTPELSAILTEKAEELHTEYGKTWEEIEALENLEALSL